MNEEVKDKQIYLCIQCGFSADALIRKYSKSTLTLQSCENCNQIIDKYIEYDLTSVFIDLLLLKISAYRHLIFNSENKGYLRRILMLTLFSYSYVEWVHEKHEIYQFTRDDSEPIFYELEWGYYQICLRQFLNAMVFSAMFLFNAFLISKSFIEIPEYFSYRRMLEGVAISYCWNLVVIPSLVWNHYATYSLLSQIALLISSIHTFRVCVHPGYFLAVCSILCCFTMQQSASHFLRQQLV